MDPITSMRAEISAINQEISSMKKIGDTARIALEAIAVIGVCFAVGSAFVAIPSVVVITGCGVLGALAFGSFIGLKVARMGQQRLQQSLTPISNAIRLQEGLHADLQRRERQSLEKIERESAVAIDQAQKLVESMQKEINNRQISAIKFAEDSRDRLNETESKLKRDHDTRENRLKIREAAVDREFEKLSEQSRSLHSEVEKRLKIKIEEYENKRNQDFAALPREVALSLIENKLPENFEIRTCDGKVIYAPYEPFSDWISVNKQVFKMERANTGKGIIDLSANPRATYENMKQIILLKLATSFESSTANLIELLDLMAELHIELTASECVRFSPAFELRLDQALKIADWVFIFQSLTFSPDIFSPSAQNKISAFACRYLEKWITEKGTSFDIDDKWIKMILQAYSRRYGFVGQGMTIQLSNWFVDLIKLDSSLLLPNEKVDAVIERLDKVGIGAINMNLVRERIRYSFSN